MHCMLLNPYEPLGIFTPTEEKTKFEDIDILIAQDQNGLNEGSFFMRRSVFTQQFIDLWRDPIFVNMRWEGQEQDAMVSAAEYDPSLISRV